MMKTGDAISMAFLKALVKLIGKKFLKRNSQEKSEFIDYILILCTHMGRQVALSVALCIWWWGQISPNQPYPKGAVPAATTLPNEWF